MTYASVNGLQLYYETYGSGRPLVLLHGGLLTIDLNFGPMLGPLAASRQVIAVELQGHGHTADTGRPLTIEALAGPGWTDELRSLQVPTLLLFGDRDFSPLRDVVELLELLPDGQLAVLPATTHVGVTQRPGEVLALITPFLGMS